MNEEKEKRYIYHNLKEMFSSSGSTAKLDLIIDTETGEVTVELKKSYAK